MARSRRQLRRSTKYGTILQRRSMTASRGSRNLHCGNMIGKSSLAGHHSLKTTRFETLLPKLDRHLRTLLPRKICHQKFHLRLHSIGFVSKTMSLKVQARSQARGVKRATKRNERDQKPLKMSLSPPCHTFLMILPHSSRNQRL